MKFIALTIMASAVVADPQEVDYCKVTGCLPQYCMEYKIHALPKEGFPKHMHGMYPPAPFKPTVGGKYSICVDQAHVDYMKK